MTQPQERRPRCITFRLLRTPAPTQIYQAWEDTSVPAPHCTPGWEAQLRLVHPPPRILRGILLACAVQGEHVRRIEESTPITLWGSPWYVTTDQARYFLDVLWQTQDVVRLGLKPVQHQMGTHMEGHMLACHHGTLGRRSSHRAITVVSRTPRAAPKQTPAHRLCQTTGSQGAIEHLQDYGHGASGTSDACGA